MYVHALGTANLNAFSKELGAFGCSLHQTGHLLWLVEAQGGGVRLKLNKTVDEVRAMAETIHQAKLQNEDETTDP
jgi:hypothetical protein